MADTVFKRLAWVPHVLIAMAGFAIGFGIGSALDVTSYTLYKKFYNKRNRAAMAAVVTVQLFVYFALVLLFDRVVGRGSIEAYATHLGLLLSQVFIFVEFLGSLTKRFKDEPSRLA